MYAVMSETPLHISNGKIVRPGFYRGADGSGPAYAARVATGSLDTDCTFCPEGLERRGVEVIEKIGKKGMGIFVIQAQPAYAHFDAQQVIDHKLIIPDAHIDNENDLTPIARDLRDTYIYEAEESAVEGTAVQSYTRSPRNPSKSIGHLHTHLFTLSFAPLSRFAFTIDEGVTEADFVQPSLKQIAEIERSRLS